MCSGGCLVVCCASAKGRQQGGTDQHTTRSCSTYILLLPLPAVIYVAEAAQTLSRNADYEAPFFKKQAAKFQQQLSDLERRKADAHKSAAAAAAEFEQVGDERACHTVAWCRTLCRRPFLSVFADLGCVVTSTVVTSDKHTLALLLQLYLHASPGCDQTAHAAAARRSA